MKKDPIVFVKHIMESIETVESYSEGVSKKEFVKRPEATRRNTLNSKRLMEFVAVS